MKKKYFRDLKIGDFVVIKKGLIDRSMYGGVPFCANMESGEIEKIDLEDDTVCIKGYWLTRQMLKNPKKQEDEMYATIEEEINSHQERFERLAIRNGAFCWEDMREIYGTWVFVQEKKEFNSNDLGENIIFGYITDQEDKFYEILRRKIK